MSSFETATAFVVEFREATGQTPSFELSLKLAAEEAQEAIDAALALNNNPSPEKMEEFLKEAADAIYTIVGLGINHDNGETPAKEDFTDEMMHQLAISREAGYMMREAGNLFLSDDILMEAVTRVHKSNMSKLGADGKPVLGEDGKVLKGPNYMPPNLKDLAEEAFAMFLIRSIMAA
jgi:hypothetical protein